MIHIDDNKTINGTFEYTLRNLESFTNYTIAVVACTRYCSQSSGSLVFRTKIGRPSRMSQMGIITYSNGSVQLSWKKPVHLGGSLDFYLLVVSEQFAYETKSLFYKISSYRNSCITPPLKCDKKDISFLIRGVNRNPTHYFAQNSFINDSNNCFNSVGEFDDIKHFYGDSSLPVAHTCKLNYSTILFLFTNSPVALISIVLVVILIGVICNLSYRVFTKLQDMKDIEIFLPNGLNPDLSIKENSDSSILNFDLVEACGNLEKIKEESCNELELYENDYCSHVKSSVIIDSASKEHLTPLITKSQTFSIIKENHSIDNNIQVKLSSAPASPCKSEANIECQTGYIEMHKLKKSVNNPSVQGYLDMSRKSSSPFQKDIKIFIRNSELNNGYIQRNSTNNSSGYVGFQS